MSLLGELFIQGSDARTPIIIRKAVSMIFFIHLMIQSMLIIICYYLLIIDIML